MSIRFPQSLLDATGMDSKQLIVELALALYTKQRLTLESASRLANLSQHQFIQVLGERGLEIHYGADDFETDLEGLATKDDRQ